MEKENTFQQANVIHKMDKKAFKVKFNVSFLESTDKHREFLRLFYASVIGNDALSQPMIKMLNEMIEDVYTLLDWAWLAYFERLEIFTKHGPSPGVAIDKPMFIDYTIDSYYPNLQYAEWIKNRRERYIGSINYLTQAEIYDESIVFTDLFNQRSITDWKCMIERWITYALDDQNNIVDDRMSSAYEVYQDYVLLQKLIECCWISIKQDAYLNFQDLCPWFNKDNYPVFSTLEYAYNPYNEIYGLFHYDSLIVQKKKINNWIEATLNIDKIWEGVPADLIDFYRSMGLMIECCWVIKELGPNYPKEWNNYNNYFSTKRASDVGEKHPFRLKEYKDKPEVYLQQFFRNRNLNDCRHILYECLYTALGHLENDPFSEDDIKTFKKDLIMLVEAGYLIQKAKYPNRVYLFNR